MSALIALFVLIYMSYHMFKFISNPITTITPTLQTAEDSTSINGYLVRNEVLVPRSAGIVDYLVSEGTRVAAGQVLADLYSSAEALETNRKIAALQQRKTELQGILSHSDAYTDAAALDQQLYALLAEIHAGVDERKTQTLTELSTQLQQMLFMREHHFDAEPAIQSMIAAIDSQLATLRTASKSQSVTSPQVAYFSSMVDGFETVLKPDMLKELTVSQVRDWQHKQMTVDPDAYLGKLVPDFEWYFVGIMPYEQAIKLNRVSLRFDQDFWTKVNMTVVSVGGDEDGQCVVVMKSRDNMSSTIRARRQTADIVFKTYTGLRIPKKALQINGEGQPGVYCLVAGVARWKKVNIIYQTPTYYLVDYDKTNASALRDNDEILINGKLYDGKKVR